MCMEYYHEEWTPSIPRFLEPHCFREGSYVCLSCEQIKADEQAPLVELKRCARKEHTEWWSEPGR